MLNMLSNMAQQYGTKEKRRNRRIKALSTQKTVVIHNNSEIPVDFSWRAFPSIQEEISQKLKLQVGFLDFGRLMMLMQLMQLTFEHFVI